MLNVVLKGERVINKQDVLIKEEYNVIDGRVYFPTYEVIGDENTDTYTEGIELIETENGTILKGIALTEKVDYTIGVIKELEAKDTFEALNQFFKFEIDKLSSINKESAIELIKMSIREDALYLNEVENNVLIVDFMSEMKLKFEINPWEYHLTLTGSIVNDEDYEIVYADNLLEINIPVCLNDSEEVCSYFESISTQEFVALILENLKQEF